MKTKKQVISTEQQGLGVALWLCPKPNSALYDKLSTLSSSVSTLFPGSPPKFEPHITITTNIQVDLDDPSKAKDDVDRILSASAIALRSLPKNHSNLVKLGKINSQRKFFQKLYFEVESDPNLISFARIMREIFVITPEDIEAENRKCNPHLYTTDSHGNTVKRKPSKKKVTSSWNGGQVENQQTKQFDTEEIRRRASYKAAEWAESEYHPHLSLVYSNLWPIDNALWRTIKTRITDYLGVEDVDAEGMQDMGYGWDGGVLKLVLCEGEVYEWIVLGSVDIH
ncbi:CPD1 [Candida oxycetoniae]|uniref:2',3'-cyclic-nucleotide 3'-phosphodiesterase n=1 Tax=Candida oxycetoniae TaxID=497107 RepID=A0AAI9SY42_9ASCO|nr:CPD1 [Candida oxycetoniae]KAI3405009.2 CPD1 [Candida oxycetoniae]